MRLEGSGGGQVFDAEVPAIGDALELDDLAGGAPLDGAGSCEEFGGDVAGGGTEGGSAIVAGESEGKLVGGEAVEGFVGTDGSPVVAHGGEVQGKGDIDEMGGGVEVEGDHHGDGILEAGQRKRIVAIGLEGAVGSRFDGKALVCKLGLDGVAGLTEVEARPEGLRGGGGGGKAEGEEKREAHGDSVGRDRYGTLAGRKSQRSCADGEG